MNNECCYPLCGSCPFDDCIRDDVTDDDIQFQNLFNNAIKYEYRRQESVNNGYEKQFKYNHSAKGKAKRKEIENRRLDMEWLARYYLLYCGKNTKYKKNTNKRKCKASKLKKQYGVTKEWVILHYGNRVLDKG